MVTGCGEDTPYTARDMELKYDSGYTEGYNSVWYADIY